MVEAPGEYLMAPVAGATKMYQWCWDFEQKHREVSEGPLGRYVWFDDLHTSKRVGVYFLNSLGTAC